MKLVNQDGSHEVNIDDSDPGAINTYRAHGYATKDEHAAAKKADAEHEKHMAKFAEPSGTEEITPVTPKAKA